MVKHCIVTPVSLLLLSMLWSFNAQAQQTEPAVPPGALKLSDLPKYHQTGSPREFGRLWREFIVHSKKNESFCSRVVAQKLHVANWEAAKKSTRSAIEPRAVWVCDCYTDYLENASRQDWLSADGFPKGSNAVELIEEEGLKMFQLEDSKYRRNHTRLVRTLDYELKQTNEKLGILRLPVGQPRGMPGVFDFRVVAWMPHSQWIVPTSQDQWLNLLENFCDPFFVRDSANSRQKELGLVYKAANREQLFLFKLEAGDRRRLRSVSLTKIVHKTNDDKTLHTRMRPEFESIINYDGEKVSSIAIFEAQTGDVWRFDYLAPDKFKPNPNLFSADHFYDDRGKLTISPELKAAFDATELETILGRLRN